MTGNFAYLTNNAAKQASSFDTSVLQNINMPNLNPSYRYANRVAQSEQMQMATQPIKDGFVRAGEKVEEQVKNIDKEKTIKKVISWGLAIATTIGVACLTNKNVNKIWKAGEAVDKKVANSNFCKQAKDLFAKIKDKNPLKNSKLLKDIKDVTSKEKRLQPKSSWAKMSVLGPKGIFSLTPSDILKSTAKSAKNPQEFTKYLEALIGKDTKICNKGISEITEACFKDGNLGESFDFSKGLMDAIKNKHNLKTTEELFGFFDKLKVGKIGENTFEFAKDLKIKGWAPFTKGNLGETMKKLAIMNGEGATTKLGKMTQQVPLILGESISNCVNDRSTFGVLICAGTLPQVFDEAQNAKKGKKVATAAAELTSTATGWAIGTAGAGAIVYSLGSLKNLKSTGVVANLLKKVGNVASMGLANNSSKPAKIIGGALRLVGVLTLSSKISTPFDNAIKKLFGLPTAKEKEIAEAEKQMMEAQYCQYPQAM